MTSSRRIRLPRLLVAIALLTAGIFLLASLAPPADAQVDGWRKANSVEKRQLKKKAKRGRGNALVTGQYGWFVTTRTSPRFGIVCGKTHGRGSYGTNIGGAIFKRTNRHWKYDKATTSGELQIITVVCD